MEIVFLISWLAPELYLLFDALNEELGKFKSQHKLSPGDLNL